MTRVSPKKEGIYFHKLDNLTPNWWTYEACNNVWKTSNVSVVENVLAMVTTFK